jgi:hypothetical protein
MLILIAGPYRSGTNDDPVLMERNLARLEAAALEVHRRGHLPMVGEWVALPIMRLAGMTAIGDAVWEATQYPVAHKLLEKCDAVYRIAGASKGADMDVEVAKRRGLPVFYRLEDIP